MRINLILTVTAFLLSLACVGGCNMTVYEYGVPYTYGSDQPVGRAFDPSDAGWERGYNHYRPYWGNAPVPEQFIPSER